jgi:hypothetical protein
MSESVEQMHRWRRPSPNPQTANAQQCRSHKALMRNIAASCFPSTRAPGGSFSPAMLPIQLLATREKPEADRTGVEILGTARGNGSVGMPYLCRTSALTKVSTSLNH